MTQTQKKLLIVDDTPEVAECCKDVMESFGYGTLVVYDPIQALQVFSADFGADKTIDGVITDFDMPKMTGGQLYRNIRLMHETMPVLIATSHPYAAMLKEIPELDANKIVSHIQKPYVINDLAKKVESLLAYKA